MSVKILPEQVLSTLPYNERETYDEYLASDHDTPLLDNLYDYYMNNYKLYTDAYNKYRLDSQHNIQILIANIEKNLKRLAVLELKNPKLIFDDRILPGGLYLLQFGPTDNHSTYIHDVHPFYISEKLDRHVDKLLEYRGKGYTLHYTTFRDIDRFLEDTVGYWSLYENTPSKD